MSRTLPVRGYRGGYLIGFLLLGTAALRAVIFYQGQPQLVAAMLFMAGYGLLYATEPWLSSRLRGYHFLYFPLQTALLLVATNLRPFLDVTCQLYVPLGVQALHAFSRRTAFAWMSVFAVLLMVTMIPGAGWTLGMGLSLVILGGGTFLISYEMLYTQTQADEAESKVLLAKLQQAHQELQAYATEAEELAAARERNRLARELHDSVSQVIFGITLTSQAARLLLERDPARVPEQLDHLEEMTGSALRQLRSLIAQLRPRQSA
ncbi:MAG TPA: histidine kinase dimerization/phosphoacceptor domain-containing protein [Anaerolineae bacterium]|nr:histidine kinase dimerization/phosphoacceptor domain-containing protein [Anaerolineae bacterium]